MYQPLPSFFFFFFNDTATTEIYTLSLHDALPIFLLISLVLAFFVIKYRRRSPYEIPRPIAGSHKLETLWSVIPFIIAMRDRKSTRLNSSHLVISYAVFCLKKKKI